MSRAEYVPPGPPVAHTIMFWLLTALAMVTFAPCVLMSIWVETEEILEHERAAAALVADLEAEVRRNEARIQALRVDPLVNERVIRRDLNFRDARERITRWRRSELAALELKSPPLPPTEAAPEPVIPRPAWMTALTRWLPAWPFRKLFAEPPFRPVMLMMAGGLLVAAFLLYGSAPVRPPSSSTATGHRGRPASPPSPQRNAPAAGL